MVHNGTFQSSSPAKSHPRSFQLNQSIMLADVQRNKSKYKQWVDSSWVFKEAKAMQIPLEYLSKVFPNEGNSPDRELLGYRMYTRWEWKNKQMSEL